LNAIKLLLKIRFIGIFFVDDQLVVWSTRRRWVVLSIWMRNGKEV
jgi:hypothetical protein